LLRAAKIGRRAARIGFDWPDARAVIPKLAEEIAEIEAELDDGAHHEKVEDEVGDLLFAVASSRASSMSNRKPRCAAPPRNSSAAFADVEKLAAERGIGRDLDALERLWQQVKREEQ
jgi:ATP diphosphatase